MVSPIEKMIDKACGVPEGWKPPKRPTEPPDEYVKAMMAVVDAAKEWGADPSGKNSAKLRIAVVKWVQMGG